VPQYFAPPLQTLTSRHWAVHIFVEHSCCISNLHYVKFFRVLPYIFVKLIEASV